jgi:LysR family transcriptional regulator, nitrogen assimilation regulatory protein
MSRSVRDIRLFIAAYEERSFTAAAARENATQSGVSQHIRKLEETFGVRLFSREKGRVVPTPAGDSYYRCCLDVLRAHEAADRSVRTYATGLDGDIVIGLMPTMTRCALAPVLARFTEAHPNMVVRIVEGYSAVLTQQAQAGELDFAIVPAFSGGAGLKSRLFLRTPEVLVASARSDLPHLAPVRLAELGPLRLVVPGKANTRRRLLETYFASNGVAIERLLELDAMLGTLDFVGRTDWVTVLPGIMMTEESETRLFTVNPIVDPTFSLDLVLIEPSRRTMSAGAAAFLDMLQDEAVQLNRRWAAVPDAVAAPAPRHKAG